MWDLLFYNRWSMPLDFPERLNVTDTATGKEVFALQEGTRKGKHPRRSLVFNH
jgi:hypothetical protein